ncbi:Protein nud1 [Purpureocillium takamizusanense]|uniref:Protein nud1 n=1 Tax=Purpureocillium takamizusanense TaxID=2060973 RepID=A0A9Q8QRY2_9HYPO|nr:Protein nud1 [Purpureocillium takamizusanense]UNI24675.1 Protein nud1 [Purpureocillium takamizusanense]
MAHAWLDSLSEDWVSQPGDNSSNKLPSLKNSSNSNTPDSKPRQRPSRIPRRTPNSRLSISSVEDTSPAILSERSASEINVSNRRLNWRLCQQVKQRAASNSTEGSVVHNSVLRKSTGSRRKTETPEWKRRLVHGKVAYGEQRDLFCSAAEGLQDMFRPPSAGGDAGETTLPSSPPHVSAPPTIDKDLERYIDAADESDGPADISPSPSPRRRERGIQFRLNDQDTESPSISSRRAPCSVPSAQGDDDIYRDESCLTAPDDMANMTRKTSGQTDNRNEDFSPILIGKHSADDGKVDFAPIDVPVEQLWQKLERLRVNQLLVDSQLDSQADLEPKRDRGQEAQGLSDTTQELGRKGAFINVQRGGRSGDGSFYHRGLSSEIGVDTSEMLPEESMQASTPKQFPSVRAQGANPVPTLHLPPSPTLPRAPFPSPEKRQARDATATSPLKLFGPYDTFTNQTLLRRISQFEEASGSPSRQSSISHADKPLQEMSRTSDRDASPRDSRTLSRFGGGDLDGYSFPGDISYDSSGNWEVADKENIAPAPRLSSNPPFYAPRASSPDNQADLQIRRRRNTGSTQDTHRERSSSTASNQPFPVLPHGAPLSALTPKRDGDSEGKRPRTSPSKDPTPKRRRTLHRSDVAFGREEHLAAIEGAHQQMQEVMGKKSKDARSGEFQLADPSVLAMRSILWPHSHTSSPQAMPPINPQLRALQAAAASPRSEHSETERKPSIRTQDFVDQAAQIMAMIRSQVRPDLASLEESVAEGEADSPRAPMTDSTDESAEPFSRPPSRDGQPRSPLAQFQEDPELASRLKKYQERSDAGDFISSSFRSMGLANAGIQSETERSQPMAPADTRSMGPLPVNGDFVSDLPNVRITSAGGQSHGLLSPSKEFPSNSSSRDFSRNFPTTSSRGSESRRTIMPESVSHLIPDRVGSMFLDKQNKTWIKRKGSTSTAPSVNAASFEDSEEDPFASIPDLTVDMTKELQNLRLGAALRMAEAENEEQRTTPGSSFGRTSRQSSRTYGTLSPKDRVGPQMSPLARGELERLEGRAAWSTVSSKESEDQDSAIHDRRDRGPISKKRNLTISFSSPVASIIHDVVAEDLDSLDDDPQTQHDKLPLKQTLRSTLSGMKRVATQGTSRPVSGRGAGFVPRPVSRIDEQDEESTVEIHPDEDRQVSIIGDHSVVSHRTPRSRHASLSFIINHTPGHGAMQYQPDESAIIGRNVGKLSLSPLSEFTLNNPEQSFGFEVSYVMGHRHMATGDGSKRVLSMTIRELVDKLSEVEPYEPFWEDLTDLDLHDKQLTSLHMLDEFCGRVVKLDASQNKLNHLDGVPSTVRQLKASCNMLTELTSWDHLMHLQYVDVSGNEIKSLSALKNLVHLRSIRADDNQLTSLDGLDCHDGLLSLRARNNLIEELDCSLTLFERLTELDLEGNMIRSIHDLELLPSLSKLVLRKNSLSEFRLKRSMKTLRQLDVSDNDLTSLDLSNLPNIQSVHADRNRIRELTGFDRARRLDSLSLREQHGNSPLDMSFLASAYEVRKLFLSGNYLGCFEPTVDFLNLQLLDLANCGLQALPDKMGQLMPNLRTLNVNFNAIADLSPLRYVPRLKKLLAAGNRLADSTAVTQLLVEFPHLTQLDVRDNPVTLGFYAPVQVLVATEGQSSCDPFTLPDTDLERDELFASRLDEATRLRRRLHHVVLVSSCRRLRRLDGLPVRRREVLAEDDLLRTLIAEGLVPKVEEGTVKGSEVATEGRAAAAAAEPEPGEDDDAAAAAQLEEEMEASRQRNESSRWSIENSFA